MSQNLYEPVGFIVPIDVIRKGVFLPSWSARVLVCVSISTLVDRDADESCSGRAFGAMQLINGVLLLRREVTGAG